jgi:hypothetical protein
MDGDFIDGDPDLWDTQSNRSEDFDEETASDERTIDDIVGTPWRVRFLRTEGLNESWSLAKRSIKLRRDIAEKGDLLERTRAGLDALKNLGLDVISFLYALSGHDVDIRSDDALAHERAFMIHHPDLPDILIALDAHCSRRRDPVKRANNPMHRFAVDKIRRQVNKEITALKPIMRMKGKEVTPDELLSIDFNDMLEKTREAAPTYWEVLTNMAETPRQRARNKYKSPDAVLLFCLLC